MIRRSPIRSSVVCVTLAVAFLVVCLALFVYFRPTRPVSEASTANTTGAVSVFNAEPASEMAATEPVLPSLQATRSPPVEDVVLQKSQADDLYRFLQESSDPLEKRKLRKQLAALQPGQIPFRLALAKYANASTEDEKLHLQSIVSQIDVSEFASEVASAASQTLDEPLFVSLAYALRNSTNILAKQELLKLAANNQLPSVRTNSLMANQGLVALHRCLLDSLQPSDLEWIKDYVVTNPLNAVQTRIVSDFIAKTKTP